MVGKNYSNNYQKSFMEIMNKGDRKMLEIKGKYSSAKIFTDIIDDTAVEQIQTLCNQSFSQDAKIRIMPDAHAGTGCVIGFTADLKDKVIPNIVGVDIGCGMLTVELGSIDFDLKELDSIIRQYVPSGFDVHKGRIVHFPELKELFCYRELKDTKRLERSIGSLGGGNHFIEIDQDDHQNKYLVIHTGSRNLGKQVADYYQKLAIELRKGKDVLFFKQQQIIDEYKAQGRKKEIQNAIKELHRSFQAKELDIPQELCYLTGEYREKYLHDMAICQRFATLNRQMIATIILKHLFDKTLDDFHYFETIHNYIDHDYNIIRKGAVSAKKDEILLIPINMRDGSLICKGKGNSDWNESAPHGAGRLYSRNKAKKEFSLDEFYKQMEGIYSTSICEGTLDECPMAYKSMDDIVKYINDTVEIIKVIKPIYNFKA